MIKALQDESVRAILGSIVEDRLESLVGKVNELTNENLRQAAEINKLNRDLSVANLKLNQLETYTRRDNLIITGLPLVNAAEAVTIPTLNESQQTIIREHATSTENAVLNLLQSQLQLNISASDISVAHRLKRNPKISGPPSVIVRFSTRKARDAVHAARSKLRQCVDPIFINEDLTMATADLFSQARKLVKNKQIFKAWTNNGDVYIKESDSVASKPKIIRSPNDLPNM